MFYQTQLFIGFVLSILGTFFGWFLTQTGNWFKGRQDDRRMIRYALFNLLETHFHMSKFQFDEDIETLLPTLASKLRKFGEYSEEASAEVKKTLSQILYQGFRITVAKDLSNMEESYMKVMIELSKIDPILAFQLHGMTSIFERLNSIDLFGDVAKRNLPAESAEIDYVLQATITHLEPETIAEQTEFLEKLILEVASKVGILYKRKTRKFLEERKKLRKESLDAEIEAYADKILIPLIQQYFQQRGEAEIL